MTKKISITLLTVIVVAASAFVYFSQKTQQEPLVQPIATTSVQVQTASTTAATSSSITTNSHPGMKLYRNEQFGFEFWYPVGWEMKDKTSSYPRSELYLSVNFPKDYTLTMDSFAISIVAPELADYIAQGENVSNVEFGSTKGITYQYTLEGVSSIVVILPVNDKKLMISTQSQYEKEFREILATLRFIK